MACIDKLSVDGGGCVSAAKLGIVARMVAAIEAKREQALLAQRSGDMRAFASLSAEVEALEDELIAMRQSG